MTVACRFGLWGLCFLLLVMPVQSLGGEPIRVGMSGAFSGPIRALGIEVYRGAMAYFEHVNSQGGINGRPVVFLAYDDAYDPAITLENTLRLVERDQVDVLFSFVGTPTVSRILPLLKVYESRNIPLFFPVTGAEPQRRPPYEQFVYNLRASYSQEVEALVLEFIKLGKTRFAILYQADSYGRSGWDGLRNVLQRHSLNIVEEATFRRGFQFEQSMEEQVDILRKANPEVVISIATYGAAAAFIRDARDQGWDVPVTNVSFVSSESMLDLLLEQEQLTGGSYTHNLVNSQVVPSYEDYSMWGVMEYRWIMDNCSCEPPVQLMPDPYTPRRYSFAGFEGMLNAKVFTDMVRKIPLDRLFEKSPADANYALLIHLGIGTPIVLGPGHRHGMDTVYYATVRDGRFVPLTDWNELSQQERP
ncbi:amino acid/amide ABC transporter substrate-binding protein, HAAT family (TC 3.A.1.4.-) [Desulfonatronum thiosulfatophilum]|uniref:Amino acid/amide ABC transporter substrate-binding protein, HAAT family (TC 3.A.1.4.-) n=1 Tax=Desulfonatronum thiosulfatophilum TaxID=617002 RepID=A0A1G6A145_9BACT|nr:ABC transporter substrate-binding protein [Desulfonatronum thiosulfatophilum]SDB02149.1 amino acid/amide ABC transporter substrate-binding protein, HAAT family (TC 3.A.1.4.-) [Desulfonatronum thiosulfatophilum]